MESAGPPWPPDRRWLGRPPGLPHHGILVLAGPYEAAEDPTIALGAEGDGEHHTGGDGEQVESSGLEFGLPDPPNRALVTEERLDYEYRVRKASLERTKSALECAKSKLLRHTKTSFLPRIDEGSLERKRRTEALSRKLAKYDGKIAKLDKEITRLKRILGEDDKSASDFEEEDPLFWTEPELAEASFQQPPPAPVKMKRRIQRLR